MTLDPHERGDVSPPKPWVYVVWATIALASFALVFVSPF